MCYGVVNNECKYISKHPNVTYYHYWVLLFLLPRRKKQTLPINYVLCNAYNINGRISKLKTHPKKQTHNKKNKGCNQQVVTPLYTRATGIVIKCRVVQTDDCYQITSGYQLAIDLAW